MGDKEIKINGKHLTITLSTLVFVLVGWLLWLTTAMGDVQRNEAVMMEWRRNISAGMDEIKGTQKEILRRLER